MTWPKWRLAQAVSPGLGTHSHTTIGGSWESTNKSSCYFRRWRPLGRRRGISPDEPHPCPRSLRLCFLKASSTYL